MADEIISSFDLDTKAALAQVDSLLKSINALEKELNQLQKEGKDTSKVTAELAKQTSTLDKVLSQETQTVKGSVAAVQAMQKTLNGASDATKKQTKAQQGLEAQTKKTANGFVTLIGRSKNLGQALTRGAGQLSNLVGGFGLSAMAISSLSNILSPLTDSFFSFIGTSKAAAEAQESVAQAVAGAAQEYAQEARDLNGLLGPLADVNTSTSDRNKLIEEIQKRYPEYLDGLDKEDFATGKIAATKKILNDRILEGILLKAQEAEATKIVGKILENEVKLAALSERGITDANVALGAFSSTATDAAQAFLNPAQAIQNLDKSAQNLNKTLDAAEFARITKENAELLETQKNLSKRFAEAGKAIKAYNLDLGANSSAAKEVTSETQKAGKAVEDFAEKIKKANQEVADDLAKNFESLNNADEPLKNSLAGLRAALSQIEKVINEQTNITDFEAYAQLTADAEKLRKEIELVEGAIKSLTAQPVEIKAEADFTPLETKVEKARLALGELRTEQARQNLDLQRQQSAALDAVKSSEAAQAALKISFAERAEKVKREQALATLRAQEQVAKAELDLARATGEIFGAEAQQAEADLLEIQRRILEVTDESYEATVKVKVDDDEAREKLKKKIRELADFAQGVSDKAFEVLNGANERSQQRLDDSISRQSEALQALLSNVETANVEQVRLEQERLDKLQAERQKAAEREAALAQIQIGVNLALAVAKTAAESGVASPITILTTLAAIAAGFIQAKQAASGAYYEGTEYLDDPKAPRGRDTITIRADRGEAIIPTKTNAEYRDAVHSIYNRKLPAELLNKVARMPADQLEELLGSHRTDAKQFVPEIAALRIQPATALDKANAAKIKMDYAVRPGAGAANNAATKEDLIEAVETLVSGLPRQQLRGRELVTIVQNGAQKLNAIKKKAKVK